MNVARQLQRFFMAIIGLACLLAVMAQPAFADTTFGKTLVKTYEVPTEVLAQIALQQRGGAKPSARAAGWTAPEFDAKTDTNPYRVVLRIYGTSLHAGEVSSAWWPAIDIEGQQRGGLKTSLKATAAAAGARVEWVASAPPLSMQVDRQIAATFEFVEGNNIAFDRVVVEVWSGIGASSGISALLAWGPLLTGLVFLGLYFWFRRN